MAVCNLQPYTARCTPRDCLQPRNAIPTGISYGFFLGYMGLDSYVLSSITALMKLLLGVVELDFKLFHLVHGRPYGMDFSVGGRREFCRNTFARQGRQQLCFFQPAWASRSGMGTAFQRPTREGPIFENLLNTTLHCSTH